MIMIFENMKNIYAFAYFVWWLTYQQILRRIVHPCFWNVLHGFLIDKLLMYCMWNLCQLPLKLPLYNVPSEQWHLEQHLQIRPQPNGSIGILRSPDVC